MNEEKRTLPEDIKQEAAKVYMSITCHQPLAQLGHIEREHIEEVIGEYLGGWMNLAKAWENNYHALKAERDEYLEALKDVRAALDDCGFTCTSKGISDLINKYNPL